MYSDTSDPSYIIDAVASVERKMLEAEGFGDGGGNICFPIFY